jgi:hypothetical protein
MSGFYVLDVPEFAALVAAVRHLESCRVHPARRSYIYVEFDGLIEIERKTTNLGEAVWFGCLTGGLDGKIDTFDSERIRLAPTNEPVIAAAAPSHLAWAPISKSDG